MTSTTYPFQIQDELLAGQFVSYPRGGRAARSSTRKDNRGDRLVAPEFRIGVLFPRSTARPP